MNEEIELNEFFANFTNFEAQLRKREKTESTIKKYLRDVRSFADFATGSGKNTITKTLILCYKERISQKMKKSTVNTKLISLGIYLKFLNRYDLHAKTFRLQKRTSLEDTLSTEEFRLLVKTADFYQKKKICAIMQTLAYTGIRISELQFFTKESLAERKITITNKGKTREIILPDKIRALLKTYCAENNIESGIIFHGRNRNTLLDKAAIWRSMQKVAELAHIEPKKIHAHNFRHFFAKIYMKTNGNILDLADILGHSSIETTRIYTRTTVEEKRAEMNQIADFIQKSGTENSGHQGTPPPEYKEFFALYKQMQEQVIVLEAFLQKIQEMYRF
ncbi:MAG: tyrosine-type recombinase/integrase [Treponema sp.]|nr:tyrosine-type recombinase/integrase [Treponema sp.]